MTYQKRIGKKGEEFAAKFLADIGYEIIENNFYSRYGEIDIVAQKSGVVVFVEVKTRTNQTFGAPEESITPSKLDRIQKAGLMWLQAHPESPDDWRIEVVSLLLNKQHSILDIQHFIDT